jgi:hypothetical protein
MDVGVSGKAHVLLNYVPQNRTLLFLIVSADLRSSHFAGRLTFPEYLSDYQGHALRHSVNEIAGCRVEVLLQIVAMKRSPVESIATDWYDGAA